MTLGPSAVRLAAGALAGGLLAGGLVLVPAAPAGAADPGDCESITADTTTSDVTDASAPLVQMQVDQAQQYVDRTGQNGVPGAGIGVAVIDSGVLADNDGIDVAAAPPLGVAGGGKPDFGQGTTVAGLIAGQPRDDDGAPTDFDESALADGTQVPTGVAPGADLYDLRVYDAPEGESATSQNPTVPDADGVLAGLQWVINNPDPPEGAPIRVVNVSMQVGQSDAVDQAVETLAKRGVLVVAASGDRPADDSGQFSQFYHEDGAPPPGEDAAGQVAPADAENAIAVSAVPGDPDVQTGTEDIVDTTETNPDSVLTNSDTDLVAPTVGGVSYAINGRSCALQALSSAWATAEVSGVIAMVWSYLGPTATAEQVRTIVLRTATGNGTKGNPVTGLGTVQPYEALTRQLDPKPDGSLPAMRSDVAGSEPATAPRPEQDVLASTRRNAVWWGLVGGAALIVALILRPLLARRRS